MDRYEKTILIFKLVEIFKFNLQKQPFCYIFTVKLLQYEK